MRGVEKGPEIIERAELRIYVKIIGNVVAVVAHRRRIKRQQPDRRDAEFLQIIQLLHEPAKVAHTVAITVAKWFNVQFVGDGVLEPKRIDGCIGIPLCHGLTLPHGTYSAIDRFCSFETDASVQLNTPDYRISVRSLLLTAVFITHGTLGTNFFYRTQTKETRPNGTFAGGRAHDRTATRTRSAKRLRIDEGHPGRRRGCVISTL